MTNKTCLGCRLIIAMLLMLLICFIYRLKNDEVKNEKQTEVMLDVRGKFIIENEGLIIKCNRIIIRGER